MNISARVFYKMFYWQKKQKQVLLNYTSYIKYYKLDSISVQITSRLEGSINKNKNQPPAKETKTLYTYSMK